MSQHTVEWYVKISSNFYAVTYLGPGEGWRLVQLEGRRPGAVYDVRLHNGRLACSCPDGARHSRPCKHARALQALGSPGPCEGQPPQAAHST
jgi:hypothetical protein